MPTTPYVYPEIKSPMAGSIADLMSRMGDPYARAAMASGQAWGQATSNVGQDVASALTTINDPQKQMQRKALQYQQTATKIASSLVGPNGEQPSPDDAQAMMTKAGIPVEFQQSIIGSLSDIQKRHKENYADVAHMAYRTLNTLPKDATDEDRAHAVAGVAGAASAFGAIPQSDVQHVIQALASGTDPKGMALGLMGASPSGRYKDIIQDETKAISVGRGGLYIPGQGVVGAPAAPAPKAEANVVYKTPDGVEHPVTIDNNGKYIFNGQDVTGQVTRPAPTATKGLETKSVLVDGKPAELTFNPADGTWKRGAESIDPTRVKPIPPASVQALNAPVPDIQLTDKQKRIAADLATGQLSFSDFNRLYGARGGQTAALKQAMYLEAKDINPDFNPVAFEAGQKMFTNPQIRQRMVSIDQLKPVIDQITQLMDKSGNADLPALNKLIQAAKFHLGNENASDLRQLQTLLGDEVGNALGVGTGSDLKTRLGLDLVNPNLSPANFRSTMHALQGILQGRRKNLADMMGPYGKQTETKEGGQFSVTAPNGKTYTFDSQEKLDAFKKEAGL